MELKKSTIGCIGAGNMGNSIISGLTKNVNCKNVYCYDIDREKINIFKKSYGINEASGPVELTDRCDIIILAVKPDIIPAVLKEIKDVVSEKILLSIAAGVSISSIEDIIGAGKNIIRVMPNTPALICEGMTVISAGNNVDKKNIDIAEEIFSLLGKVIVLPEKMMDAVTAVSGCGPAYGFTMIQAMADGGVKMGLPRDKALLLAAQTISGAAKMVLQGNEDPITLRGRVTSPGGSTIDAVHVLERAGFSGIVIDAIEVAAVKSEKLGRKK